MTRRRRRRLRLAMWAGVACSVLGGAAWVWSGWYDYTGWCVSKSRLAMLEVGMGTVRVGVGDAKTWGNGGPPGTVGVVTTHPRDWYSMWLLDNEPTWHVVMVPLWFAALVPLVPAALCFYFARAPRPGHCPRCHYDLSGIPAGICPECGKAPAA